MDYFTLKEDKFEVQSKKQKRLIKIYFPLTILLLFSLLRGFDFVTIEYHKTQLNGKQKNVREVVDFYANESKIEKSQLDSTYDSTENIYTRNFAIDISTQTKEEQKYLNDKNSYLEYLIKLKLSEEFKIDIQSLNNLVTVDEYSNSGFYWFPLVKNGRNFYKLSLNYEEMRPGNKQFKDAYHGQFSGVFGFEVYGICSIDQLNKEITEEIAEEVMRFVIEDFESYK